MKVRVKLAGASWGGIGFRQGDIVEVVVEQIRVPNGNVYSTGVYGLGYEIELAEESPENKSGISLVGLLGAKPQKVTVDF